MGDLTYIVLKEMSDMHRMLGASIIATLDTHGFTQKYHLREVEKLKTCILEMQPLWLYNKLTGKEFRRILYANFKEVVEDELCHVNKSHFIKITTRYTEAEKKAYVLEAVKHWLKGVSDG